LMSVADLFPNRAAIIPHRGPNSAYKRLNSASS
jgi:hypothetical protein